MFILSVHMAIYKDERFYFSKDVYKRQEYILPIEYMSVEWMSYVHLFVFIFIAFYGFVFSKNKFDLFYLFVTYGTVTQWTFLNGECVISYLYKRKEDPNYIAGKEIETNEFQLMYNIPHDIMRFIVLLQTVLWLIGTYLVFKRNKFPLSMSISFVSLFLIYYLLRKWTSEPYKNQTFLIFQEIIKYSLLLYGIILFYGLYKRLIR